MLCHNLLASTFNRTGQRYNGHFEIWIYNYLQKIVEKTHDHVPDSETIRGWVNGSMYTPTSEVYGILPIPLEIVTKSAMQPFINTACGDIKHAYLAKMQGTQYAVINVHTVAEKQLFASLMWNNHHFNRSNQDPDWKEAVREWNHNKADGKDIFYKVCIYYF